MEYINTWCPFCGDVLGVEDTHVHHIRVKPCPLCGSENAEVIITKLYPSKTEDIESKITIACVGGCRLQLTMMFVITLPGEAVNKIVNRWNKRE